MKKIMLIIVLSTLFSGLAFAKTIESKKISGNFSDKTSWVGEQVPTDKDEIIIKGKILIDVKIDLDKITIEPNATLQIGFTENNPVFVSSKFTFNQGQIFIKEKSSLHTDKLQNDGDINNLGVIEIGEN